MGFAGMQNASMQEYKFTKMHIWPYGNMHVCKYESIQA